MLTLSPNSLESARLSSSRECTIAGSLWETKSTSANPRSERAAPLMFPSSLKRTRLSSNRVRALIYSPWLLSRDARSESESTMYCLSPKSLQSDNASSFSERVSMRLPLAQAACPNKLRENAISTLSLSSRHSQALLSQCLCPVIVALVGSQVRCNSECFCPHECRDTFTCSQYPL